VAKQLTGLDAVWGGEWGRLRDGCVRWRWRSSKEKGSFGGKWRPCGVVILYCEEWRCCTSQITLGFLVVINIVIIFEVKVGMHQHSALSSLLFVIVMEALSRENFFTYLALVPPNHLSPSN